MVANIAFMGNAVVEGIFGNDILFDYLMFTLPINLFLNSIGASMALISNLPALITIPLVFLYCCRINHSAVSRNILSASSVPTLLVFIEETHLRLLLGILLGYNL